VLGQKCVENPSQPNTRLSETKSQKRTIEKRELDNKPINQQYTAKKVTSSRSFCGIIMMVV
jgi:hypothetical protein